MPNDRNDENSRAYYLAAMAVTANSFEIDVRQLKLDCDGPIGNGIVLEPLGEWCDLDADMGWWEFNLIEEYLTTLVSGSVGRMIWMKSRRSESGREAGGAKFEWVGLNEALRCEEKEADSAFAIALGRLATVDDGYPDATLYRLWQRARALLCQPENCDKLHRLAQHLKNARQIGCDELQQFFGAYKANN